MDSIQEIIGAGMVIVGAVAAIVARFKETSSSLSFIARLFKALDLTQVFDSSRSLGDEPKE